MSDTYRHKVLGKYKRIRDEDFCAGWEYLSTNHPGFMYTWWNSTPSWWNNEFHTRPARTQTRNTLRKINLDNYEDDWDFPNYKKPHIYYW
jgi:hypothetical protein